MRLRARTALSALVLVVATGGLTACGGDSSGSSGADLKSKVIDVTISGDTVTPNGDRVSVAVDQPITLEVTADAPGEIHVHSSPEQELEYKAGHTEISMTPIKTPGLVEVESHALEKTIVQLEVK